MGDMALASKLSLLCDDYNTQLTYRGHVDQVLLCRSREGAESVMEMEKDHAVRTFANNLLEHADIMTTETEHGKAITVRAHVLNGETLLALLRDVYVLGKTDGQIEEIEKRKDEADE